MNINYSTWRFAHPTDMSLLEHVYYAQKKLPERFPKRLAAFLDYAGILDRQHPEFEKDIALLAESTKILMPGGIGDEPDHSVVIAINDTYTAQNNSGTLARFREGANEFHQRDLDIGGFPPEFVEMVQQEQKKNISPC